MMAAAGPIRSNIPPALCLLLIHSFGQVSAYYCEWDYCQEGQYCCGDNLCCNYVYSPWYFWAGMVFLIIMLSSCGGFFRYCYPIQPHYIVHRVTSYIPVPTHGTTGDDNQGLTAYEDVEAPPTYPNADRTESEDYPPPPVGPPPSYFQAVNSVGKDEMKVMGFQWASPNKMTVLWDSQQGGALGRGKNAL